MESSFRVLGGEHRVLRVPQVGALRLVFSLLSRVLSEVVLFAALLGSFINQNCVVSRRFLDRRPVLSLDRVLLDRGLRLEFFCEDCRVGPHVLLLASLLVFRAH